MQNPQCIDSLLAKFACQSSEATATNTRCASTGLDKTGVATRMQIVRNCVMRSSITCARQLQLAIVLGHSAASHMHKSKLEA